MSPIRSPRHLCGPLEKIQTLDTPGTSSFMEAVM